MCGLKIMCFNAIIRKKIGYVLLEIRSLDLVVIWIYNKAAVNFCCFRNGFSIFKNMEFKGFTQRLIIQIISIINLFLENITRNAQRFVLSLVSSYDFPTVVKTALSKKYFSSLSNRVRQDLLLTKSDRIHFLSLSVKVLHKGNINLFLVHSQLLLMNSFI